MKKTSLIGLFVGLLMTAGAMAQRGDFDIGKIEFGLIKSPDYQVNVSKSSKAMEWLTVEVEFAAKPEFTDELTFKYYILVGTKLLTGEVTHVNIPKGRDLRSVVYVSPRNMARVLEGKNLTQNAVSDVGIQILNKGALVAEKSAKSTVPQWWQTMQQVPGMVLNKMQTPFAPLWWDRYEEVKGGLR